MGWKGVVDITECGSGCLHWQEDTPTIQEKNPFPPRGDRQKGHQQQWLRQWSKDMRVETWSWRAGGDTKKRLSLFFGMINDRVSALTFLWLPERRSHSSSLGLGASDWQGVWKPLGYGSGVCMGKGRGQLFRPLANPYPGCGLVGWQGFWLGSQVCAKAILNSASICHSLSVIQVLTRSRRLCADTCSF